MNPNPNEHSQMTTWAIWIIFMTTETPSADEGHDKRLKDG